MQLGVHLSVFLPMITPLTGSAVPCVTGKVLSRMAAVTTADLAGIAPATGVERSARRYVEIRFLHQLKTVFQ